MNNQEQERLKSWREYFEVGCLCLQNGDIELKDLNVGDKEAALYYEDKCKCSRNYKGCRHYES